MTSFIRTKRPLIALILVLASTSAPKNLLSFPSLSQLTGRQINLSPPSKNGIWRNISLNHKLDPSIYRLTGLQYETFNRGMENQTRRILITAGTLKPGVEGYPQQFFKRYIGDLGLGPNDIDVVKKTSIERINQDKKANATHYYDQYVRNEAGNLIPVMGARAGLEVDENSRVVSFYHSLVPDLTYYLKSLTPKLSYENAMKLVSTPNQTKMLETGLQGFTMEETSLANVARNIAPSPPQEVMPPIIQDQEALTETLIEERSGTQNNVDPLMKSMDVLPEEVSPDTATPVKVMKGEAADIADSLQVMRANSPTANSKIIKLPPQYIAPWQIAGEKLIGPKVEEHQVVFFKGNRESRNARLAWKIESDDEENSWIHYVDALSGEVLSSEDALLYSDQVPDTWTNILGSGIPYPYYGNTGQPIPMTTLENLTGGFFMLGCLFVDDTTVKERCNKDIFLTSRIGKEPGEEAKGVTDTNNIFAEDGKTESIHRVDVSAMKGMQLAVKFFEKFYVYTDPGKESNLSSVFITRRANSAGFPIAAYDRIKKRIVLDGFGDEKLGFGPMVAYDVIGHEYLHSILDDKYSNLGNYSVKPSLLPIIEGTADFIGEVIENTRDGNTSDGNWLYGEEIHKPYLTDIANPKNNGEADTYEGPYFVKFSKNGPNAASYIDPKTNVEVPCVTPSFCSYETRNSTVWSHFLYMLSEGGEFTNHLQKKASIKGVGKINATNIALGTLRRLSPDDDMPSACNKAVETAKSRRGIGDDPQYPEYIVESTIQACHIANLGDYGEKRLYFPSKESGKDMGLSYSPRELKWEVFPYKESGWVVEVFNFPLLDSVKIDPGQKYDIQTAFIDKDNFAQEGDAWFTNTSFELEPGKVYYWHICPIEDGVTYDPQIKASVGRTLSDLRNCENWKSLQTFSTKEALAIPLSPSGNVAYTPLSLAFTWKGVKGMTNYDINVYENDGKGGPGKLTAIHPVKADETTCDDKLNCKHELPWEKMLYSACWSVFSGNDDQVGAESDIKCWGVSPSKSNLISPLTNVPFSHDLVTLKWEKAEAATSYVVFICDRNAADNTPNCDTSTLTTDTVSGLELQKAGLGAKGAGFCWAVISKNDWMPEEQTSGFTCVSVDAEKPRILSPTNNTILQPDSSGDYAYVLEWADSSSNSHKFCMLSAETPPAVSDNDSCWGIFDEGHRKVELHFKSAANPKLLHLQIASVGTDGKTFISKSDPVIVYLKAAPAKPVITSPGQNQIFQKAVGNAFDIPIHWTGGSEVGYHVFVTPADLNPNVSVGGIALSSPPITGASYNQALISENSKYKVIIASINKNNIYDGVSHPVYFSTGLLSTKDDPPDPNGTPICDLTKAAPHPTCPGMPSYAFGVTTALCTSPYQFQVQQYPGDQSKITYDLEICKTSGNAVSGDCQTHSFSYSEFGAGSPIKKDPSSQWAWRARVRVEGCPISPPSDWLYFSCGPTGNCPDNIKP